MTEPTPEQQAAICAQLARAMGWTGLRLMSNQVAGRGENYWGLRPGETGQINRPIPNPFTSAADSRALVEWLAADDDRWLAFMRRMDIHGKDAYHALARRPFLNPHAWIERWHLTAPLPVIAMAAAEAITAESPAAPPPSAIPPA